jgi:phosphatidylethanolamine-binding protein (PEBP) family uncharacterized protein
MRYFVLAAIVVLQYSLAIRAQAADKTIVPVLSEKELSYTTSTPPLELMFKVAGGHYSGAVTGGNVFIQNDIPDAPIVHWSKGEKDKLYTLMMIDFDGNANGSWPDLVAPGKNSPVRHWIVGNIPGELLAINGYAEIGGKAVSGDKNLTVLQTYRAPHIPVVSDRYAAYLFEQNGLIDFAALPDSITNFDHKAFLDKYHLTVPVASNWFVSIYTSETPFSGKAFKGNDVRGVWHSDLGKGKLGRE